MKFISLFSGIGGFDLALERADMVCDTVCEIDKDAQKVLRRHFPHARLVDDVRKVGKETHERKSIDLICGGFPCQDVSIAGKRAGIAGERSGLWFEFARIIDELEPNWVVIENVPGLLSSNNGKDFAVIIQWLAQRGYGVTWRVLDAQYFGVPQRRRRVFIVGSLGNGRSAEVLFESEGRAGDTPQSRKAGKDVAFTLGTNTGSSSNKGDGGINKTMIANTIGASSTRTAGGQDATRVASSVGALQARDYKGVGNQYVSEGKPVFDAAQITSRQHGSLPSEVSQPLNTLGQMSVFDRQRSDEYGEAETVSTVSARDYKSATDLIATSWDSQRARIHYPNGTAPTLQSGAKNSGNIIPTIWEMQHASEAYREAGEFAPTLQSRMGTGGNNAPMVGVRRLTPTECERLQGFPEIRETIIIDLCLDYQKNSASVEIQSRKSQKHAGNVEKTDSLGSAKFVEVNLNSNNPQISEHALPSVLINCGERKVEIHSQGKSLLSVNFAEDKNSFLPLTRNEDFALLLAGANSILEQITLLGVEELHRSVPNSIVQRDGQNVVRLSGNEIMQLVSGAKKDLTTPKKLLKSIISSPLDLKITDTTLTTLFSCVLGVISGYIPNEMLKGNSFQIEINTSFGWTDGQADTNRYKQLGNAVAVPVVEWIGKRIKAVTCLTPREPDGGKSAKK